MGVAVRRRRNGQGAFWGDDVGPNPTDRAKKGTKRSLIVEADGGPLGVVIAGANVNDFKLLQKTIESIVVPRPDPEVNPQNLCLDKGYDNAPAESVVNAAQYTPHIRRIGEEKLDQKGRKKHPARRWVVERTIAWLNGCRAILTRHAKKSSNYLGLIMIACALLWYRRAWKLRVLR